MLNTKIDNGKTRENQTNAHRADLMTPIIPKPENLASLVLVVRGEKVLLDSDLAELYGVEARALNQAVARNRNRFPEDFMFQLTPERMGASAVTSCDRIGRQRGPLITTCDEWQRR